MFSWMRWAVIIAAVAGTMTTGCSDETGMAPKAPEKAETQQKMDNKFTFASIIIGSVYADPFYSNGALYY